MFRARVVDKKGDDDGSHLHSQDADEFSGDFADSPREVKKDNHAQPETSAQQFSKNKKKKSKSRKNNKKNRSDSINRDALQNTENMEEAHCTSSRDLSVQAQPINESTTEKANEEIPWPDLNLDLISVLLHKLSYVDCLAATSAIPSWRQAVEKPLGPCLLSFANDNKTYTISSVLHDFEATVMCPDFPDNIKILASKHGWLLLMAEEEEEEEEDRMPCLIFFYNPVSKVIIKLPPYNHARWEHFSFSAPPDSSNCVVVASNLIEDYRKLIICEKGSDEWIDLTHENEIVEDHESLTAQRMSPIFHKGWFYWIGADGRVGEFDLRTRSLAVHGKDMRLWPSTFRFYLVESDDDLYSVWSTREGDTVRIFKLDLDNSPDIWKETHNLGGNCFFVGLKSSVSLTTRVLSCKEEKIYFQMVDQAKKIVYYSVDYGKMHPHVNFMGCSELFYNYCWFEPQWVEPKFQELHWF